MPPREINWTAVVSSIVQGAIPVLLSLCIGLVYFYKSPPSQPLAQRVIISCYGVSILLIYICAWAVFVTGLSNNSLISPFLYTFIVPLILIVATFVLYRGPKWVHLLQIVNVIVLAWTYFIGGMAVTNDWL